MRTVWDNGVWSEIAENEDRLSPLIQLVRRRQVQVLLNPTTLAELHGIGPDHEEVYAARNRTVRALGWDRILSDAKELITVAFARYAARFLGGEFARVASSIEVPIVSHERLVKSRAN